MRPLFPAAALAVLALVACDRTRAINPTGDSAAPSASVTSTASAGPGSPPSPSAVSDTIITGKVKAAIAADNGMKDSDISVKTENGVVTLTGSVKSTDQVTLASALAQRQQGVARVENQVAVR